MAVGRMGDAPAHTAIATMLVRHGRALSESTESIRRMLRSSLENSTSEGEWEHRLFVCKTSKEVDISHQVLSHRTGEGHKPHFSEVVVKYMRSSSTRGRRGVHPRRGI